MPGSPDSPCLPPSWTKTCRGCCGAAMGTGSLLAQLSLWLPPPRNPGLSSQGPNWSPPQPPSLRGLTGEVGGAGPGPMWVG